MCCYDFLQQKLWNSFMLRLFNKTAEKVVKLTPFELAIGEELIKSRHRQRELEDESFNRQVLFLLWTLYRIYFHMIGKFAIRCLKQKSEDIFWCKDSRLAKKIFRGGFRRTRNDTVVDNFLWRRYSKILSVSAYIVGRCGWMGQNGTAFCHFFYFKTMTFPHFFQKFSFGVLLHIFENQQTFYNSQFKSPFWDITVITDVYPITSWHSFCLVQVKCTYI